MNNLKFFIIFALIVAVIVAAVETSYSIFIKKGGNLDPAIVYLTPIPGSLDIEFVDSLENRAAKYLLVSIDDFEKGVDIDKLNATPTPSVTPNRNR